jgi:nicotinate-nucleotide adenylyltransferase
MPNDWQRAERLGILGGTFDPPHLGHMAAAAASRAQLGLDRVLFVVANDPWQKSPLRPVTPAGDRLAMVEATVASVDGAEVSRIELDRGGPSYTVETAEALALGARQQGAPEPELFLIVGADVVPLLSTWHRHVDLAGLVTLAVVSRPGVPNPAGVPGWRFAVVSGVDVDVSSSAIREAVAAGTPITGLVPSAVEQYIEAHTLYAVGE